MTKTKDLEQKSTTEYLTRARYDNTRALVEALFEERNETR